MSYIAMHVVSTASAQITEAHDMFTAWTRRVNVSNAGLNIDTSGIVY